MVAIKVNENGSSVSSDKLSQCPVKNIISSNTKVTCTVEVIIFTMLLLKNNCLVEIGIRYCCSKIPFRASLATVIPI